MTEEIDELLNCLSACIESTYFHSEFNSEVGDFRFNTESIFTYTRPWYRRVDVMPSLLTFQ